MGTKHMKALEHMARETHIVATVTATIHTR